VKWSLVCVSSMAKQSTLLPHEHVAFKAPPPMVRELRKRATAQHRSISGYLRHLLIRHFDQVPVQADAQDVDRER
jgi:hypothetical protein